MKFVASHGMSQTRLYKAWINMRSRCTGRYYKGYKNYGGRGIKVCKEWMDNFVNFKQWALNNGYQDNLTIDRIDVNKDYEPTNCRWIPKSEQENNKRRNVRLTYNGITHNLMEWSKILGVNYTTLKSRIQRGWNVEDTLCKPIDMLYSKTRRD